MFVHWHICLIIVNIFVSTDKQCEDSSGTGYPSAGWLVCTRRTRRVKPAGAITSMCLFPFSFDFTTSAYIRFMLNCHLQTQGARCSSVVKSIHSWCEVVGSILHGVDPLSYFSLQPVLHDWCNKGLGMCYPVCGMMVIKEPLLLIGSSRFPLSLSEWSFTICLMPYNVNKMCWVHR